MKEQKLAYSSFSMGLLYDNAWGVLEDNELAEKYFAMARECGLLFVADWLNMQYLHSSMILDKAETYIDFRRKAVFEDNPAGFNNLGECYVMIPFGDNLLIGAAYFYIAQTKGNIYAKYNYNSFLLLMEGVFNEDEALCLVKKFAIEILEELNKNKENIGSEEYEKR